MLASLLRPRPRAPYRSAPYRGVRHYEHVLGTSMELALLADGAGTADRAEARVWAEIDRLEAIFSVYRPDSEFNRWQATHGEDRPVSPDLAAVLLAAERYRAATDGAFLPTVEALTRGLRARESGGVAPETEALDPHAPLWSVDLPALVARRLTQRPASLNALAKGYILDRAAEAACAEPGMREVMLNLGGDLRHLTADPAGGGRVAVAIADPAHPEENAPPLATVLVSGRGVATSGGYRRGFRIDGAWRGHLLDPATGDSVAARSSVTVVAPTAIAADAWATALSVLGPERGEVLLGGDPEIAVLHVLPDSILPGSTLLANAAWRSLPTPS